MQTWVSLTLSHGLATFLILGQLNSFHAFPKHFSGIHFSINPPIYAWVLQVATSPQVFPPKLCMQPFIFPILATCPVHLILLDLITRRVLRTDCRSWISSLCNFCQSRPALPLRPKYAFQLPTLEHPHSVFLLQRETAKIVTCSVKY